MFQSTFPAASWWVLIFRQVILKALFKFYRILVDL